MIHDRNREFIERFGATSPRRISEPIRVELGPTWAANPNAQHAFLMTVNLAARLTDRVSLEGPPGVGLDVWHPIGTSPHLLDRAEEICELINRPAISEGSGITVSFGGMTREGFVIRPSVRGWVSEVRTDGGVPDATSREYNPLASAFAACLAISEAFKEILISLQSPRRFPHRNVVFSLLTMDASIDGEDLPYPSGSNVGPLTVIGAGALGHAFMYGLSAGAHHGLVHVVDFDDLDPTNLNRHLMADSHARGNKAVSLSAATAGPLKTTPFPLAYNGYRGNPDCRLDRVVSLVDDRNANAARRQIQSDLPRTLHHAATGETSFTILHVDFLRGGCLGCLFAPSAEDLNPMTGVADLTGIPLARVSQMGPAGLLDSGDLESIRRRWGFDEKDLIAFLGRPLQVLIDSRICGEQRIVTHSGRFNASIGFLSAAAGIALAAEVVKTTSGLPRYTLDNFLQVSPFSPADLRNRRLPKNPRCGILCGDPLMRQAYVDKWAIGIR